MYEEIVAVASDKLVALMNGAGGAISEFAGEVALYGVVSNLINAALAPVPLILCVLVAWNAAPDLFARAKREAEGNYEREAEGNYEFPIYFIASLACSIVFAFAFLMSMLSAVDVASHLNAASKAYFAPKLYVIQEVQKIGGRR